MLLRGCALARRPRPFALRYRRARAGRPVAQLPSLCSLCLCALCVQRRPRGHALFGIDLCWSEAAFDTEDTETQRTQRNIRYFLLCLSKPFLRYLGTWVIALLLCPHAIRAAEIGWQ